MMDDFTTQLVTTLMSSLQAVDADGNIDHKTRLSALKESRNLLATILPKMSQSDRENFSKKFTDGLSHKIKAAQDEEAKLNKLLPRSNKQIPAETDDEQEPS